MDYLDRQHQHQHQHQHRQPPQIPATGTPPATPSQDAAGIATAKAAWVEDRTYQQQQTWNSGPQAPMAEDAPAAASTAPPASTASVSQPASAAAEQLNDTRTAPAQPPELLSNIQSQKPGKPGPAAAPPPPPPPAALPPAMDSTAESGKNSSSDDVGGRNDLLAAIRKGTKNTQRAEDASARLIDAASSPASAEATPSGSSDDAGGRNDLLAAIRKGTKNTQRAEDASARLIDAASSPASTEATTPAPASGPAAPPAPTLPMDLQASIQHSKPGASNDETSEATPSPQANTQTSIKKPKAAGKPPPAAPPPPPADYVPRSQRDDKAAKSKHKPQEKKQAGAEDRPAPALPLDLAASIKQGKKNKANEGEKPMAGAETAAAPKLPTDLAASIKKSKDGSDDSATTVTAEKKQKHSKLADSWMKKSEPEPEPEPEPESVSTRELLIDGTAVEFAHARFGASNCDFDVTAVAVDPIKANGIIGNAAHLAGNIAVAERGEVPFVEKAISIQNAGAVAALFVNTDDDLFTIDGGPDDQDVKMPIVFVRARDGAGLMTKPSSGSWPACKLRFPARQLCDGDVDQEPFDDTSKKKGKLQVGGFNPFG
jgi:hypothetical protein